MGETYVVDNESDGDVARADVVEMPMGISLPDAGTVGPSRVMNPVVDPFVPGSAYEDSISSQPARPQSAQASGPIEKITVEDAPTSTPASTARAERKKEKREQPPLPMMPQRLAMFIAAPVGLAAGAAAYMKYDGASATTREDYDELWRRTVDGPLGTAVLVGVIVPLVALFLWGIAALVNARRITPLAASPVTLAGFFIGGPAVIALGAALRPRIGDKASWLTVGGGVVVAFGALFMPLIFRATARKIGSPSQPWSSIFWLRWLSSSLTTLVSLMIVYSGLSDRALVFVILLMYLAQGVIEIAWAVSWWRAMSSFERACRRNRRQDEQAHLPEHLLFAQIGRM